MDEIWSDRGSVIIGSMAKAFYEDCGLVSRTSTSNNHQAVGAIEAQVKKLKYNLTKLTQESRDDWDELVGEAIRKMRFETSADLGTSPSMLRYGRQMKMPAHLKFGLETKTLAAEQQQALAKRVNKLADEEAIKQKQRYDVGRKPIDLKVGDLVWWEDHYRRTFGPRRTGPYEIKAKKSDLSFELKEVDGGPRLGRKYPVVNGRDLMRYESAKEVVVEAILEHRGSLEDPKGMDFKVQWIDGDVTWEPLENMFDTNRKGLMIYNDKLVEYARLVRINLPKRNKGDVDK
jgi:hypothetical protein